MKKEKKRNMTQLELANRINSTIASVSRYEHNSRDPKLSDVEAIALAFGVSLSTFLSSTKTDVIKLKDLLKKPISDILSKLVITDIDIETNDSGDVTRIIVKYVPPKEIEIIN